MKVNEDGSVSTTTPPSSVNPVSPSATSLESSAALAPTEPATAHICSLPTLELGEVPEVDGVGKHRHVGHYTST